MTEVTKLTLETLAGGGALELAGHELRRVFQNIRDPNTPWKGVRLVKIELKIAAMDEQREQLAVTAAVSSKLIGPKPLTETAFLGEKDGQLVAVAFDPRQSDMFSHNDPGVRPIRPATAQGA